MIRWWTSKETSSKCYLIYKNQSLFSIPDLEYPMYVYSHANPKWETFPIIGPNEMSRWENGDAT